MHFKKIGFLVIFLPGLLTSCKGLREEKNSEVVAKVLDKKLYQNELKDVVPANASKEDSVRLVKTFINNWVRQNLLLAKAESNLSDEQKNVEKLIEDYRQSLIIFTYEKELIRQKLDTSVAEEEIEKYYNENSKNFELKDNIVKVIYIKVNKKAPNITRVKNLYKSEKPEDRKLLEDYCHQYAENFYLDDESWLLFDDLLKEIPIRTYNQEQFLQNNRFVEVEDSSFAYFVNIRNFKIKESLSPLSFEKEKIRNIILNKRKLNLISKMKDDLYEEAVNKKQFEIIR